MRFEASLISPSKSPKSPRRCVSAFPRSVSELLSRCTEPDLTANARGKALEDLVAAIFETVTGVEVRARNAKSVFENEELDLLMTNRGGADGLPALGPFFSVECKNWSRPVGSTEVAWFATKLRRSNQSFGVLVAANGVTGRPTDMTAANFEAATALTEGQAVVVLTLREIGWIGSGEELADVLTEKYAHLVARRELYVAEVPPERTSLPRATKPPTTRSERDARLLAIAATVAADSASACSLEAAVDHYKAALATFLHNEQQGFEVGTRDESDLSDWIDDGLDAFENLEAALERLARAAVMTLRESSGPSTWSVDHLALGLDTRTPSNLEAPPDSPLAELLVSYWMEASASPLSYVREPAVLCLLGWALEWLIAIDHGGWPLSSI